jgi:hypothetical protein
MKKYISILALVLLCFGSVAQERITTKPNNFFVFTAGPSFPIGDFASTNLDNQDAGMAKTGFTLEYKYGHRFNGVFGLSTSLQYGRYDVDKAFLHGIPDVDIKPWEKFALLAGPMMTSNIGLKSNFDLSILSGLAMAQSPEGRFEGTEVLNADWSAAVPLKIAADFRFQFNRSGIFFIGANYLYMKPKFEVLTDDENLFDFNTYRQKMHIIGMNAGLGFTF